MNSETTSEIKSYLDWSDKGDASIWRYIVGFVLSVIVFQFLGSFGSLPLAILAPNASESLVLSFIQTLLTFVIPFIGIPLIVRFLHKRPFWSVAMPKFRFNWSDLGIGFLVGAGVALVTGLIFHFTGLLPMEVNPLFDLKTYLIVAVIGLVGIFVQAGSEELLFRGYFTQLFNRISSKEWIFLGIPALLFAVPHIANIAAFGGSVFVLAPYFVSGLLYGWAAYKSGSLWMALGLHLANNYTSEIFAGTKGDVLPPAAPFMIDIPGLGIGTLAVVIQSLVIVLVLYFIFKKREA